MSKESKLHEKHQAILAGALRDEDNKHCADCLAKGPRWASWNLGVFVCIRCAGIHRNLGVHISRVKSVNLDSWTPEQIQAIQSGGNGHARAKYEANLPANFRRPVDDYAVEQFIRNKYERKLYLSKVADPAPKASKAKKDVRKAVPDVHIGMALTTPPEATPTAIKRSPSPQPKKSTVRPQPVKRSPSPSRQQPDLIALETTRPPPPPTVDLLTGLPQATPPSSHTQPAVAMGGSGTEPAIVMGGGPVQQPGSVKDNIMSLYNVQPARQSYTAQGYPATLHYQQQQAAAVAAAQHRQSAQLAQVQQVQQQMTAIKQQAGGGGGAGGGQTLNPHLW